MELALTPLEFARRARRLYADREAVVDGDLRLTYAQFFDRCDRWSQVLQQRLSVGHGDRVAYIAPNTHAQLESFYAVPQLGAVLVPINYRLTADDFAYIIGHSGARIVCAHSDYLEAVDSIRDQIPNVEHFVALEGSRDGWLDYESALAGATRDLLTPKIAVSCRRASAWSPRAHRRLPRRLAALRVSSGGRSHRSTGSRRRRRSSQFVSLVRSTQSFHPKIGP